MKRKRRRVASSSVSVKRPASKRGRSASRKIDSSSSDDDDESEEVKPKVKAPVAMKAAVVKKRPASPATDPSEERLQRRALPCWFEGPLNDADTYKQFAPRSGDLLDVIPLSEGDETAVMTVEVIHADRVDEMGLLAILKFLSSDDEKMAKWAKTFVTGSTKGDVSSFHFCKSKKCKAGDTNTIHIHKWKFVTGDIDGKPLSEDDLESVPSADEDSGVKLLEKVKSKPVDSGNSTMRRVAELRERLAGAKAKLGAAKSSGSGGVRLSNVAKSLRGVSASRNLGDAEGRSGGFPSAKASGTKVTVASVLADRAAEKAVKVSATLNAAKAKRKEDAKKSLARSSGNLDDDDVISDAKSGDEKVDDDEDSVFRKAPSLFRVSKILSVASLSEGTLMQNGVQLMARALSMHQRGGSGVPSVDTQGGDLHDVVTTYLTTAMIPGAAAAGQHMGIRTIREMRTLAEAMDAIIRGEPAKAGDILMQRFRAAEMAVSDGHWTLAQHLELIPETTVSSIPLGMRAELIREVNRRDKYSHRGGQGRGQRQ